MHFHAEHALFFERRQPLWVAALAMALTSSVLIVNAGTHSTTLSLVGSGIGARSCCCSRGPVDAEGSSLPWRGPWPSWPSHCLVGLSSIPAPTSSSRRASGSCAALSGSSGLAPRLTGRRFDNLLLRLRIPEDVVASLDHALMHGVLTQREWVQRRDAAHLRLGSPRLPLAAWGPLPRRRGPACLRAPRTSRGKRTSAQRPVRRHSGS